MTEGKIRVSDKRTIPFYVIPKSLLKNRKLSYKAILAYNALAYYSHDEQVGDIPVKDLGAIVGISEDTVRRGLIELERLKVVLVRKKFRKATGGNRMALPNKYILVDIPEQGNVSI